jgi:hypothetical protein
MTGGETGYFGRLGNRFPFFHYFTKKSIKYWHFCKNYVINIYVG